VDVRPYRPSDREGVRRVCFETGYMGDPVAWQWRDRESFADLFSGWYTDHAPEDAQVVVDGDEVVGYLLGCRDTTRVDLPPRTVARHLVGRGLLVRPGTAPVLWRTIADAAAAAARRRMPPAQVVDERWPAHLHIDLLPEARGTGIGRRLIHTWLDVLRDAGIAGCHLVTWAENDGAIAFFEAVGFTREGDPQPMLGLRSPTGGRHHTQLMVQSLEDR
jgi:ribosomal protein S18 acetylase RimI-like enzyme